MGSIRDVALPERASAMLLQTMQSLIGKLEICKGSVSEAGGDWEETNRPLLSQGLERNLGVRSSRRVATGVSTRCVGFKPFSVCCQEEWSGVPESNR